MKMNKLLAVITAAVMIIGCASSGSTPSSSGVSTGSSRTAKKGGDELDNAIREMSDYLNKRIPAGSKVVFLNIKSDWPDLSNYILDNLMVNAVNDDVFAVVDRQQLDAIRSELNFQWSGEVSDASAQEIGEMLGAQSIVSGSITTIGSVYRIQVRAIEVKTAKVQGQFPKNIDSKGTIVSALTKLVEPAGTALTSTSGTTRPSTPTQTATSATTQTTTPTATPAASGTAQATPAQNTFPIKGLWKLTGKDSANWEGELVIEEIDRERFSGYFDWYRSGTTYSGREYFKGTYDSKDRLVVLEGYRLVNPIGIQAGKYQAFLSKTGLDFISGTWAGGGRWEARWQKNK